MVEGVLLNISTLQKSKARLMSARLRSFGTHAPLDQVAAEAESLSLLWLYRIHRPNPPPHTNFTKAKLLVSAIMSRFLKVPGGLKTVE